MTAQIEVKTDILSQTATRELLYIFKASQFGLVYSLNVMLVFFGAGSIISLLLLNSGDMAIRIIEFYVKIANISDGEYAGRIPLAEFFWYGYIFLTLIVYFTPEAARPGDYRNKTKNCVYPDNRHFIVYSDNLYFFY